MAAAEALMADILWPDDLAPYKVQFYLQPHVGGQESPLTRTRKVYGLSAPRWLARLTFRGGYDGIPIFGDADGFGPRLDSLIADLEGGLNKAVIYDFRRPRPLRPLPLIAPLTYAAAGIGSTIVAVAGFSPNAKAFSVGDYLGGDGRPHIVSLANTTAGGGIVTGAGAIMADGAGVAIVGIRPPLSAAITAGTPLAWPATGRFELTSEDAGANETEVGRMTEYTLDFTEDLG